MNLFFVARKNADNIKSHVLPIQNFVLLHSKAHFCCATYLPSAKKHAHHSFTIATTIFISKIHV
jgi:hypothetical protein